MTKNEILDYVMTTPANTNRQILNNMLDAFQTADNKEEISLNITENGTYTPTTGKVYSQVVASVPQTDANDYAATVVNMNGGSLSGQDFIMRVVELDSELDVAAWVSNVSELVTPPSGKQLVGLAYNSTDTEVLSTIVVDESLMLYAIWEDSANQAL